MKVLVFSIGSDRYGLPLPALRQVLPVLALKAIPLAPDYVAGLMDLHGAPVPVIELSRLAGLPREQLWLDSRILLLDYPVADDGAGAGATRMLGLLVEHVLGIETIADRALLDPGIDGAPFLGAVAGALQLVTINELLPPDVRALLFARERSVDASTQASHGGE
jgi:chemotaxis-related protein WspB